MPTTELTHAECAALEREAHRELENSCGEYALAKRPPVMPDYAEEHRGRILAVAELLGALDSATCKATLDGADTETSVEVEFSNDVAVWLAGQRDQQGGYIHDLDTHGEGDYEHVAGQVFLLHVLNRLVPATAGGAS